MVNYQNGMIYKLCCNDLNITDIYIGSTVNFKQRKRGHKKVCNNPNYKNYNLKVYKFIRDNGGFKNWSMILIANTPCDSKLKLGQFERYYYEKLNPTLNIYFPQRTKKEWVNSNKERLQIKQKKYRDDNKNIIKIKQKEYYKDNKEHLKIKQKEWREKNEEKIKIKRALKINCSICDKFITKNNIKKHQRSKKCIEASKID